MKNSKMGNVALANESWCKITKTVQINYYYIEIFKNQKLIQMTNKLTFLKLKLKWKNEIKSHSKHRNTIKVYK